MRQVLSDIMSNGGQAAFLLELHVHNQPRCTCIRIDTGTWTNDKQGQIQVVFKPINAFVLASVYGICCSLLGHTEIRQCQRNGLQCTDLFHPLKSMGYMKNYIWYIGAVTCEPSLWVVKAKPEKRQYSVTNTYLKILA